MSVATLLLVVCGGGLIGGIANALLTDNGFLFPQGQDAGQGTTIWRPGVLGNLFIGAIAAGISWGLYGPFAASYLVGSAAGSAGPAGPYGLTLSAFVGSVLVGVSGARWLTNEIDKSLLKAAAGEAAGATPSTAAAVAMATASPANALSIAKSLPDAA